MRLAPGVFVCAFVLYACARTPEPPPIRLSAPAPAPALPLPAAEPRDINPFRDGENRFSLDYPNAFSLVSRDPHVTQDWRQQATGPGTLRLQLTLPRELQPKTNFSEAKLTVGTSSEPSALATCTTEAAGGNGVETSKVTIHAHELTKLVFSDAAAGNRYDTTSYRALQGGVCYAIEYTIHSTNLGNYSPDQGIAAFDRARIVSLLEGVVQSFVFTPAH